MFSLYHFIWIFLCILLICSGIAYCKNRNISTQSTLCFCTYGAVVSETVKVLSCVEVIPSSDGLSFYPYLQLQHMPFHLCSLMIIVIFLAYFTRNEKTRELLLQFSYPVCLAGGVLAIFIPTIFINSISSDQAFSHPLAYQYFLYHCMLVVLSYQIARDKSIHFNWKGYWNTLKILGLLAIISIYLNSLFSAPVYENGELISIEYSTNLMYTFRFPLGFSITCKTQWLLYILFLVILASTVVALLDLPLIQSEKRDHRNKAAHKQKD